jgi:hypothetical protein
MCDKVLLLLDRATSAAYNSLETLVNNAIESQFGKELSRAVDRLWLESESASTALDYSIAAQPIKYF